jgi:hypothetical protein
MTRHIRFGLGGAALFCSAMACAFPVAAQDLVLPVAQTVTREKGRLVLFDGETLTLERLGVSTPAVAPLAMVPGRGVTKTAPVTTPVAAPQDETAGKADAPSPDTRFSVMVTPQTRYVGTTTGAFADIKPGDFAGAAVTEDSAGRLRARQLYLYPEALRGTGEGRFPESGRIMINGTVSGVTFASDADRSRGNLALAYRGSVLTPLGKGRTVCEGRAAPLAVASPLECKADVVMQVAADTPVTAMTLGDRRLLEPGVIVTVTVVKGPDGRAVTPGLVIEKAATVEKPQSAP